MDDVMLPIQPERPAERPMPDLRILMREATRVRHERLDGLFDWVDATSGLETYHAFVIANEASHRIVEPALEKCSIAQELSRIGLAARRDLLSRDCAAMGLVTLADAPFAIHSPDRAEAAGIAYVLEGSRLGARFLHRRLVAAAANAPLWAGASFLYLASAAETDSLRPLMVELETWLPDEEARARAVAAANLTFDHFLASALLATAGFERDRSLAS